MSFRNQIVGLIRFSHPSIGGFKKTPNEARDNVYNINLQALELPKQDA